MVRRAGAAWNQHDRSMLFDALSLANEFGLPQVHAEYGHCRLRFDLAAKSGMVWVRQQDGTQDDSATTSVRMQEPLPAAASAPASAGTAQSSPAAPPAPTGAAAPAADAMHAAAEAEASSPQTPAEIAALCAKAATRREAKRRQRHARKVRERAKKAADRQAAPPPPASAQPRHAPAAATAGVAAANGSGLLPCDGGSASDDAAPMTTDAPSPAPRVERGLYVPVVSSHMDHQSARTMILDHARAAYHRFARQHQREKYLVERTVAFHLSLIHI